MRGFRLASRFSATSSAYRRPLPCIIAPMAKVLPPAPAQKSTAICPRFTPVSKASSWLPSSCTSSVPSRNSGCLLSAGLSAKRMPHGEYGVGLHASPSACKAASILSRRPLRVFTRTSSGAPCTTLRPNASTASSSKPSARMVSISHCGSSAAVFRLPENSLLRAFTSAKKAMSSSSATSAKALRFTLRPNTSAAKAARRGWLCGRGSTALIFWPWRTAANTVSAISWRSCRPSLRSRRK